MRVLLTSFGITTPNISSPQSFIQRPLDLPYPRVAYHHSHGDLSHDNIFYRMPPVNMRAMHIRFMPDYATMLLAQKLVMDEESYDALVGKPHPIYADVAEAIKELKTAGFVELTNFRAALARNSELLSTMLENDLRSIDPWVEPLQQSIQRWCEFSTYVREIFSSAREIGTREEDRQYFGTLMHEYYPLLSGVDLTLRLLDKAPSKRRAPERDRLREVLSGYLSYVNANLVLAREFNAGFHDWDDYLPLYRRKFLGVGQPEPEVEERASELRKLFSVSFPDFSVESTAHLISVLQDKRVEALRELVAKAVAGEVTFDEEFARDTLKGLLEKYRESSRWRTITSFITKPLGKIPIAGSFLEPLAEWLTRRHEDKTRQEFRWYYMLSEAAGKKLP
jgi:hypothetical protein